MSAYEHPSLNGTIKSQRFDKTKNKFILQTPTCKFVANTLQECNELYAKYKVHFADYGDCEIVSIQEWEVGETEYTFFGVVGTVPNEEERADAAKLEE